MITYLLENLSPTLLVFTFVLGFIIALVLFALYKIFVESIK
jgi:hypothetical protein